MKKITWNEFCETMRDFNEENGYISKGNEKRLNGIVVFTADSFTAPYTEVERSYQTNNDQKAFLPHQSSNSIFADCLDGTDLGVRLDWYMGGKDGWKVDYCYLLEE